MATSAITSLLAVFNGDTSVIPPAVRFVPAAFLFVHAEPLPEGMKAAEVEGYAGVSLEGLSPLPLDQLAWGYLADTRSKHILLFGAFQDRLNVENLSADQTFFHVLPSFFAATPKDGLAHWVFIWEAGHVAGIHYAAGEIIPSQVEVERLKEDTVADAFAGREHLLKRLAGSARTEAAPGLLTQPDAVRGANNRLSFSFLHYNSPDTEPTKVEGNPPVDVAARWSADLRGAAFRASEQKRRQTVTQAGLFVKIAAAGIGLLIIGQAVAFGMRYVISKKQTQIANQTLMVTSVDNRLALLKQITKFTDNQLHPFEMLGVINPYRPKGIQLGKTHIFNGSPPGTTAQSGNTATVPSLSATCVSTDPQDVTNFVTALSNSKIVAVDITKLGMQTTLSRTTFTLALTYKSVPEAEPMPPEAPVMPDPSEIGPTDNGVDNTLDNTNQFGPGGPNEFGPNGNPADGAPADANQLTVQDVAPVEVPSGPTVITSGAQGAPVPAPAPTPAPAPDAAPTPAPGG